MQSTRSSPSTPYPISPNSPSLSRSASFRIQLPAGFNSTPILPLESGTISPFRQPGFASEYPTMDPSHSVRSASPSETSTSSLSGLASLSAVGSSSATSSVYGDSSTNRSSLSSRNSLTMSQRSRSPKKGPRRTALTKLTDLDRRRICEYRDANPKVKQDDIGEMFAVERSTISKILKNRAKWMAIAVPVPEIEEDANPWPPHIPSTTLFPTLLAAPSLPASPSKGRNTRAGRFPDLERLLLKWARNQLEVVGPSFIFSDELIQKMGKELSGEFEESLNFKASAGWVEKFKLRAGIREGKLGDADNTVERLVEGEQEDVEQERDAGEEEDDSDGEFLLHRQSPRKEARRKLERSRRPPFLSPASSRRHSEINVPSSASMAEAVQMDLDSRASERGSTHGDDIESTPTHSSSRYSSTPMSASGSRSRTVDPYVDFSPQALLALQQQRNKNKLVVATGSATPPIRSSPSHSSLAPLVLPTFAPSSDNPSFFPYTFTGAQDPFGQDTPYPLQSPFQPGAFPTAQYINHSRTQSSTPTASGATSPNYLDQQHGRSNSTASSNSGYSGLTTFSQPSNGSGTPLTASSSCYSQFSTSISSLPCTPAPGYFSHGDGQQSQLQLAFASDNQGIVPAATLTQSQPPSSSYAPRRATISGGAPVLQRSSTMVTRARTMNEGGNPVAFEVALASLQNALKYLSTEGNGYVSPMDLIVLSDLTGKMKEHQKAQSPPPSHQHQQQASFMTPSLSMSSLPARGLQMQRTNSSGSTMHSRRALRTAHSSFGSLDYTQSLLE